MTWIDGAFLGIIVVSTLIALSKGFIRTLFGFASMIISLFLTYTIYPYVSEFIIKNTEIFNAIKTKVISALNLEDIAKNAISPQAQIDVVNKLAIPKKLKDILIANNNTEVYKMMGVDGIGDYIGGVFATIAINVISFILVYFLISISLGIVVRVIDLISKLPVLHQINKMAGAILGSVIGVLIIWVVCTVFAVIMTVKVDSGIALVLDESSIGKFFFNTNPMMQYVSDITKTIV
jgi:uncharacterized membrane protein required for colicin V production